MYTSEYGRWHNHAVYICKCKRVVDQCPCPEVTGKTVIQFNSCWHLNPPPANKIASLAVNYRGRSTALKKAGAKRERLRLDAG